MQTLLMLVPVTLTIWIIFLNVIGKKYGIAQTITYIIILTALSYVVLELLDLEFLGSVVFVIVLTFAAYKKSDNIISLSALYSMVAVLISFISGYVSGAVINRLMNLTSPIAVRQDILLYYVNFILCLAIGFPLSLAAGKFLKGKMDILTDNMKQKLAFQVMIGAFITFLLYLSNIFLPAAISNYTALSMVYTILIVSYFIYLVFATYAFAVGTQKEFELARKAELLDQLKLYMANLESFYEDTRKHRHDYMNILSALYGYIEGNDIEGIKNFFIERISPFTKAMPKIDNELDKLRRINITELKGLLSIKLLHAQTLGIKVHVEVQDVIEALNFDMVDLCRAIGILLDNAIEACENQAEPKLDFAVVKRESDIRLIFSNTVASQPPHTKIFLKGFTTKPGNTGLGLYILNQIIDKYNNVSMQIEMNHNIFTVYIDIED